MRKVAWQMSFEVYEQYLECLEKLATLDPDYDFEAYHEVSETLAQLDGFPVNCSIDEDIIIPVLPKTIAPLVVLNVHE